MQPFGFNDVCGLFFIPLVCETGAVDTTKDIIKYCGASSVAHRKEVNAAVVQDSPNTPGTTGAVCLRRRQRATRADEFLDIVSCGINNPTVLFAAGLEAPIVDDATSETVGYETPTSTESNCSSCKTGGSDCTHSLALGLISNSMCGDDKRTPDGSHKLFLAGSLEFEPVAETETYGQGFTQFRTLTARLRENPAFVDPFGVDPRGVAGFGAKRKVLNLDLASFTELEALVDDNCECYACTDPNA